jgi:hypothetical protein
MDKIAIRNVCYQKCAEGTNVLCYCTIDGIYREIVFLVTNTEQVAMGLDRAIDKHLEKIAYEYNA